VTLRFARDIRVPLAISGDVPADLQQAGILARARAQEAFRFRAKLSSRVAHLARTSAQIAPFISSFGRDSETRKEKARAGRGHFPRPTRAGKRAAIGNERG